MWCFTPRMVLYILHPRIPHPWGTPAAGTRRDMGTSSARCLDATESSGWARLATK